jgi:hypothetical protein
MFDRNQFSEKYLEISMGGGQTPAFSATQKNANKKKERIY